MVIQLTLKKISSDFKMMKKYILLSIYIWMFISCSKSDGTKVNIINPNNVPALPIQ